MDDMAGLTLYNNSGGSLYGAVKGAVNAATNSARSQKLRAAQQQLALAARQAQDAAKTLKMRYATPGLQAAERAVCKMEHDGIVELYTQKIKPALQAFSGSINPYQASEGYYSAGGTVVAPPKAGQYLFVPFEAVGSTAIPAGTRFETVAAGNLAANVIVMRTPVLSWLKYRVRALVIHADKDAAAANDSIGVEDFRILGGPTLLDSENPYPVELFRLVDTERVGLRYNGVVTSPNQLQLTIRGEGLGQAQPTGGNSVLTCTAIVEVIEDDSYQTLNNPEVRAAFRQSQGPALDGGYTFPEGTPIASTMGRVQMVVETADGGANNAVNARFFQLTGANPTLALISDQIGYADSQVVGIQVGTTVKALVTDQALLSNIRVGGDTQLPAAEGEQTVINFLGDEGGPQGGGSPVMQGFRHYPKLSATNRLRMTLQARIGVGAGAGNAGMTGARIVVPYIALITNRIKDDVLGLGVGAPFAQRVLSILG